MTIYPTVLILWTSIDFIESCVQFHITPTSDTLKCNSIQEFGWIAKCFQQLEAKQEFALGISINGKDKICHLCLVLPDVSLTITDFHLSDGDMKVYRIAPEEDVARK